MLFNLNKIEDHKIFIFFIFNLFNKPGTVPVYLPEVNLKLRKYVKCRNFFEGCFYTCKIFQRLLLISFSNKYCKCELFKIIVF